MEYDYFAGSAAGKVVRQNVERIRILLTFTIPVFVHNARFMVRFGQIEQRLNNTLINPMEYDYLTLLFHSLVEEWEKLVDVNDRLHRQFQQPALMSPERILEMMHSCMHLHQSLKKVDLLIDLLFVSIRFPQWYITVAEYSKCTPFSESNERPPLLSIQALTTPAESELFVLTRLSPRMWSYSWEQANRNAIAEYHAFASFYERMYMNTIREADSCMHIMERCPKQYYDERSEIGNSQVGVIEKNDEHVKDLEVNKILRDPERLHDRQTWFTVTQYLLEVANRIDDLYNLRYLMMRLNNVRKEDVIATKQGLFPRNHERFAGIPLEQINECRFDQIPKQYFAYRELHRMPYAWKLIGPEGEVGEEMDDVVDVMRSMRDAVAITQFRGQVPDRDFRGVYEGVTERGAQERPYLDDYTTTDFLE